MGSGHYNAFARKPTLRGGGGGGGVGEGGDGGGGDTWHMYDDCRVSAVSRREVFDAQPYILLYERTDGEGLPPHASAPLTDWGKDAMSPSPATVWRGINCACFQRLSALETRI